VLMKIILKLEFFVTQVSILDPSHLSESDIDVLDDDAASRGIISTKPLYSQNVRDVKFDANLTTLMGYVTSRHVKR
jgi:hypothetical protein